MPTLNWLTRGQDIAAAGRVVYRLLEEVIKLSAKVRNSYNILIQGDNLELLKTLLPFHAGQVKCIYIDPPYNTHSTFERYDDNRVSNSQALPSVPSWARSRSHISGVMRFTARSRRMICAWKQLTRLQISASRSWASWVL